MPIEFGKKFKFGCVQCDKCGWFTFDKENNICHGDMCKLKAEMEEEDKENENSNDNRW